MEPPPTPPPGARKPEERHHPSWKKSSSETTASTKLEPPTLPPGTSKREDRHNLFSKKTSSLTTPNPKLEPHTTPPGTSKPEERHKPIGKKISSLSMASPNVEPPATPLDTNKPEGRPTSFWKTPRKLISDDPDANRPEQVWRKASMLIRVTNMMKKSDTTVLKSAVSSPAPSPAPVKPPEAPGATRKGRGDFQSVIQHYTQLSLSTDILKLYTDAIRPRSMLMVSINGREFHLPTTTCIRIPTLREQMLENGINEDSDKPKEVYFERNAIIFQAVVDYVTNGELHVPREVCPKLFAKDITYWGFDIEEVEPCCFPALMHFLWEQDKLARFQAYLYNRLDPSTSMTRRTFLESGDDSSEKDLNLSGMGYCRAKVWDILDQPFSSRPAQIYFAFMCVFISMSFFSMAAETDTSFQKNCTVHRNHLNAQKHFLGSSQEYSNESNTDVIVLVGVDKSLIYLETVWAAYFYVDYFLRVVFHPHLRHFFKDIINVTDGLAIVSTLINALFRAEGKPDCWVETLTDYGWLFDLPKLFRTLRLIRPMSKLTGFRLMWFTLKCSFHELMLVLMLLLFLVVVFSSLLYYLGEKQHIRNIPEAMWFTIQTMTTVGYGDVVPVGWRGILIGSVVAVFGVIMMSMTTPIMVSNFHSLYINAVVGEPSTIKKVRTGVDKPQTSSISLRSPDSNNPPSTAGGRSKCKQSVTQDGSNIPGHTGSRFITSRERKNTRTSSHIQHMDDISISSSPATGVSFASEQNRVKSSGTSDPTGISEGDDVTSATESEGGQNMRMAGSSSTPDGKTDQRRARR